VRHHDPVCSDGLECVDVSDNFTFGDFEVNARPGAKLLDYIQEGYHIFYGVCGECIVINVPFVGQFEATRGNGIAIICGHEPTDQRFDHEVKNKGGQGGALEGSLPKPHG
jgi:hypothetical protein